MKDEADYHRLSVAAKRERDLSRMREPSITCAACDTQIMPVDMPAHRARCPGPREPGPGAKWIPWREALQHVHQTTLKRWVKRGYVHVRGERGDREYFLRDIIALSNHRRWLDRRR